MRGASILCLILLPTPFPPVLPDPRLSIVPLYRLAISSNRFLTSFFASLIDERAGGIERVPDLPWASNNYPALYALLQPSLRSDWAREHWKWRECRLLPASPCSPPPARCSDAHSFVTEKRRARGRAIDSALFWGWWRGGWRLINHTHSLS